MNYEPKTEPFGHQARVLEETWGREFYAVFWEQGTGKSKLIVDTAAMLWSAGEITGVLIVAPSSVHTNWVRQEIPTHLPDDVAARSTTHVYRAAKAATQWHRAEVRACVNAPGLAWLAISYDSLMTEAGRDAVWRFLKNRRVLYVADESMYIKSPGAKRTQRVVRSGRHAPYRRILCGTPAPNSPFDLYPQFRFLKEDFWARGHGHVEPIRDALSFRHTFGVFRRTTSASGKTMEFPVDFRRIGELREWIQPYFSRVLKEQVLDLPAKLYSQRTFELTPAQRRLYDEIRDTFMTELDDGTLVTAPMVLVRMLRLAQITCGYLPTDRADEPLHRIDPRRATPRLQLVEEARDQCPHQAIIWAQWNEDIDQMLDLLGAQAVRFDGQVSEEERERNKAVFRAGDAKFFVSKPSTGGTGHTLTEAKSVYYYNQGYNLAHRLQSEDRAHRIGQDCSVLYTDFMAEGTIDEAVVKALRRKFDVASQITGDEARSWLK